MRILATIVFGLVATKSVEFGSDEEKFMKREIEYCVENRLSNQGCLIIFFSKKKLNSSMCKPYENANGCAVFWNVHLCCDECWSKWIRKY